MKVESGNAGLVTSNMVGAKPEKQVLAKEEQVKVSSDTVTISPEALQKLNSEQVAPQNGGGWEPPIKPENGGGWEPPIKPQNGGGWEPPIKP